MPDGNASEDLRDFLIRQASEATFLFNKVYSGLGETLQSEDHRVHAAIALTSAIIKNIAIIGNQVDDD